MFAVSIGRLSANTGGIGFFIKIRLVMSLHQMDRGIAGLGGLCLDNPELNAFWPLEGASGHSQVPPEHP